MMAFLKPGNVRKFLRTAAMTFMGALLVGCGTHVTPPLNPPDPTAIYLCDYGVHSSLLLPISKGRYVEFLYGDWNWAALGHNTPFDAIGALCFSQQPTLGRRFITEEPWKDQPQPLDGPISETRLIVDGSGCTEVVNRLMARWEKHRSTAITTGSELSYVKDDVPYSWTHDCNHLTAECLRAMGCKVDGLPFWSNFKVGEPARH
jgi:hypothetical protein